MARLLDRARPYAEVHGLPGAYWSQDGINYSFNGNEAIDIAPFIDETPIETEEIIPAQCCIEVASLPVESVDGRSLDDMHWRHLKALIESFGGEWTNRKNAIEFMKGKR